MTFSTSKMVIGFSQSELFFQWQMAACCGDGDFAKGFSQSQLFILLQMAAHDGGQPFSRQYFNFLRDDSEAHS